MSSNLYYSFWYFRLIFLTLSDEFIAFASVVRQVSYESDRQISPDNRNLRANSLEAIAALLNKQ